MHTLQHKLSERAAITQQMAELAARAAQLDAEIQTLYEAEHPKQPDSEFIIQARKDCERLLKTLRGHPYKLLKTLLDSPLGIVDYDETVAYVWPEGVRSERTPRRTVDYLIERLSRSASRYYIRSYKHAEITLDVISKRSQNIHK